MIQLKYNHCTYVYIILLAAGKTEEKSNGPSECVSGLHSLGQPSSTEDPSNVQTEAPTSK